MYEYRVAFVGFSFFFLVSFVSSVWSGFGMALNLGLESVSAALAGIRGGNRWIVDQEKEVEINVGDVDVRLVQVVFVRCWMTG
jgi:hypothetical protein